MTLDQSNYVTGAYMLSIAGFMMTCLSFVIAIFSPELRTVTGFQIFALPFTVFGLFFAILASKEKLYDNEKVKLKWAFIASISALTIIIVSYTIAYLF